MSRTLTRPMSRQQQPDRHQHAEYRDCEERLSYLSLNRRDVYSDADARDFGAALSARRYFRRFCRYSLRYKVCASPCRLCQPADARILTPARAAPRRRRIATDDMPISRHHEDTSRMQQKRAEDVVEPISGLIGRRPATNIGFA